MSKDIMTTWMRNGRYAEVNGIRLRPRCHPIVPNQALSVQRGQASTYFLESNDGTPYVIKKFSQGKFTGIKHLTTVNRLLPKHPALESGTKRQILSPNSLSKNNGYYTKALADWLENTILMPKIQGLDWSAIIGKLRDESLRLDDSRRLSLCKNLADIVVLLESKSIAHRDLSGGNVFIHNKDIKFIDFDSIFHPSLAIPNATTIGSEGYIAPFANDVHSTWCSCADRFALTILCIEILILDKNSPVNHEGGIFDQEDLYNRSGKTIVHAENILQKKYPQALKLFDAAKKSDCFGSCPKPTDWLGFCNNPSKEIKISISKNIGAKPSYKKPMPGTPTLDISSHFNTNPAPVHSNRYASRLQAFQAPIKVDDWMGSKINNFNQNRHKISVPRLKNQKKFYTTSITDDKNIFPSSHFKNPKSISMPLEKPAREFSVNDLPKPTIKLPKKSPFKTYNLPDNPLEI